MTRNPFGDFNVESFHCGRCGTLLDGGTDEPVSTIKLREAITDVMLDVLAHSQPDEGLRIIDTNQYKELVKLMNTHE